MPYLGLSDGDEVLPPQVPDGSTVACPVCGEEMSVVRSYNRGSTFVSRHFSHKGAGKEMAAEPVVVMVTAQGSPKSITR